MTNYTELKKRGSQVWSLKGTIVDEFPIHKMHYTSVNNDLYVK